VQIREWEEKRTMPSEDQFHWAKRVARKAIQRLYASDADGMLDTELLEEVHYAPVRLFKQRHSHSAIQKIAAQLGIQERRALTEDELIPEILRRAPELATAAEDDDED
jgi:hypothetical protein